MRHRLSSKSLPLLFAVAVVIVVIGVVGASSTLSQSIARAVARATAVPQRIQPRRISTRAGRRALAAPASGPVLLSDSFAEAVSAPNAWGSVGNACLTAGTSANPATSIRACGAAAAQDGDGAGALQLTGNATNQGGMVVAKTALSTANGLQVVFTDFAFHGTATAADGITLFFTDASQPAPTAMGQRGGALGYANGVAPAAGIANAFAGIAFDEYGNFSNPTNGLSGGPGKVSETVAVRGAASIGYKYLGGVTGPTGLAVSLPFRLDASSATTRPATAPTMRVTLLNDGTLSVDIDRHDGSGFVGRYAQTIVGINGEPAVPAQVYVGFTGSTGGSYVQHQVGNFRVSAMQGAPVTPTPTPVPTTTPTPAATGTPTPIPTPTAVPTPTPTAVPTPPPGGFTPTQIANLQGWYDAADAASVVQTSGAVGTWRDKSGHANDVVQGGTATRPTYVTAGIDGNGSIAFANQYLVSSNRAFSPSLFNESTVFVVGNQTNTASGAMVWTGPSVTTPRYSLNAQGTTARFDFNSASVRLAPTVVATGPALWTAVGSASQAIQSLSKNGNVLTSRTGAIAAVTGNYPLALGATTTGGTPAYLYGGQLGEVLIYSRPLASAETAQVEGYLACKWGLQNRLPANHPYRVTCPQGGTPNPIATPTPGAGALQNPAEVRSQNGALSLQVIAQADPTSGNPQLTYNGLASPPTLRLLPGDTLNVQLINSLPVPPANAGYLNDTNLHYHGLHVNPNAPGDDSIDMIAMPGQALNYQIRIPVDHPPGLYWYHSHAHGEAERQTLAGMSGALIIDGIAQYVPQVASVPERVLIVRDALPSGQALPLANRRQLSAMQWAMQHAKLRPGAAAPSAASSAAAGAAPAQTAAAMSHTMTSRMTTSRLTMAHGTQAHAGMSMDAQVRGRTTRQTRNPFVLTDPNYRQFRRPLVTSTHCTAAETASKVWTVNGQTQPSIGIKPGEKQFWRLVNAGADTYLKVQVDGTQMQIVALDGVPLTGAAPAFTVSQYVVPPASRIEFLVTGPAAGTTAYLRTNCFDSGAAGPAMPAAILASINPAFSATDNLRKKQRIAAKMRQFKTRSVRAIAAAAVSRTQTLYYSDQNTINGSAYDPSAPPQFYAQSGTVEEWNIVNNSSQVHTFHIHQIHFVVEAINGVTQTQQYTLDNVNVPAADANGPGSVKLLMDFGDPAIVGTFLLHCHILSHEDGGMMAKIRVGTAPPMTASTSQVTFATAISPAQIVTISGGAAPYSVSGCGNVANASVGGNAVTLSPTAPGGCVITVSDSTGLVVSIPVTVQGAVSTVSLSQSSIVFSGPNDAAQSVGVSGGTVPYTLTGCNGITNAAMNSGQTAIVLTPIAPGSCTLGISDTASNRSSLFVVVDTPPAASLSDNVTFHQNNSRTGWYQGETQLTVANVAATSFGLKARLAAPSGMPPFGKVYAQPLYVSNQTTADYKPHNLVIISTATDQVYAFDEQTLSVVWHTDFTNPAAGITQQSYSDTGCADIHPDIGITGTPVIDRSRSLMYVVVATKENGTPHMRLHAISLSSGSDALTPVEVSGTLTLATGGTAAISAKFNNQRSALLEANGNIYVALASHCDYSANVTHGWVVAYSASTLAPAGNLLNATNGNDGSGYYLGSPWMAGYGPAADAFGNIYFATGNGPFNGTTDFSMSVLKVPGNLDISRVAYFTPATAAADSGQDQDLGSGGVLLLPDQAGALPHLMVQGGKSGAAGAQKYILNRDALGGQKANDSGAVWHANTGGSIWGGPAYFQDANGVQYVVYGTGQPLSTYRLNLSPVSLSVQSSANVGCLECRDQGSQPVVSSNGTQAGTAVVWALKTPGNSGGTISLYAFDALNMAHKLYSGAAGTWLQTAGTAWIGGALVSPTVANGRVYVPTDGSVAVFGNS